MMVKAGCAERRRLAVKALPCVQSNVMVITAGGKKRSLVSHALHEFKPKHVPIKSNSAFQISHFQMHMADPNLRINRLLSFRRPLGLASGLLRQSEALCLNLNINIDQ